MYKAARYLAHKHDTKCDLSFLNHMLSTIDPQEDHFKFINDIQQKVRLT